MATFEVAVQVGSVHDEHFEFIEMLVDCGASYSIFPARLLRELGVEPIERQWFRFADERRRELDVGTARVRLDGRERYDTAVFGEEDIRPVLGAFTLEAFRLAVDPVGGRLIPAPDAFV